MDSLRHLVAFLLVVWASLATAHAEPADISAAARSVVRVVLVAEDNGEPTLVGHGSGFAVAPNVILTNAHVVEPARTEQDIRIGIVPSQGKGGWFGRIIAFAPMSDLALVRLTEEGSLPPATLFTGAVGDGADVFAVGYPGNVDLAQGLNVGDIVTPTSPVKTRGNVSAGRSSKSFETILHTAPIGAGNSGGPLLDPCGRVIGANSFGTLSSEGDSEFYFAVSVREILRFLRASDITPHTTGMACRSMADLDRAEAARLAGERFQSEEQAHARAAKQRAALEKAQQTALFEVIGERDAGMALAGLALVLALAAGGAAYVLNEKDRRRDARIAGGVAGALVLGAIAAWLLRPGFGDVDSRAKEWAESGETKPGGATAGKSGEHGALVCTLDLARSRLTVSGATDLRLDWKAGGCANGDQQFGLDAKGWSKVTLSDADGSATVSRFDPASGSYDADRYLVDAATMASLRAAAKDQPAARCGGDEDAARKLGQAQAALVALLPETPNERLVYQCRQP
jgi:hypothetical protein